MPGTLQSATADLGHKPSVANDLLSTEWSFLDTRIMKEKIHIGNLALIMEGSLVSHQDFLNR